MASKMSPFRVSVAFIDSKVVTRDIEMWDAYEAAKLVAGNVWWETKPNVDEGGVKVENLETHEVAFYDIEVEPELHVSTTELHGEELARRLKEFDEEQNKPFDDDDFTSGGGGNFAWKYRNKGYIHFKQYGKDEPACQAAVGSKMGDAPDQVLEWNEDLNKITCPGCKHVLGIEPCGQHTGGPVVG